LEAQFLVFSVLAVTAIGIAVLAAVRLRLPRARWYKSTGAAFADLEISRRQRLEAAHIDSDPLRLATSTLLQSLSSVESEEGVELADEIRSDLRETISTMDSELQSREAEIDKLTIVLFGRTKAGKSSLFSALTGTGFGGIGDGRQNYTTEIRKFEGKGCRIIDAPGISGVGSGILEPATMAAVRSADVILVQASDDAIFKEDIERLMEVDSNDRPIVVALNVKARDLSELVHRPDRVFRGDDLRVFERRLRIGLAGQTETVPVVPHHALAAAEARRKRLNFNRRKLWESSRVSDVIEQIVLLEPKAIGFANASFESSVLRARGRAHAKALRWIEGLTVSLSELDREVSEAKKIVKAADASLKTTGNQVILDELAKAEEQLLSAIDQQVSSKDFSHALAEALTPASLQDALGKLLDDTVIMISKNFEDFAEDLQLAAKLEFDPSDLTKLHRSFKKDASKRRALQASNKARARTRSAIRAGTKFAGLAVAFASRFSPFAPAGKVAALVVSKVGDKAASLINDHEIPPDDRKGRASQVRAAVNKVVAIHQEQFQLEWQTGIIEKLISDIIQPLSTSASELVSIRGRCETFFSETA